MQLKKNMAHFPFHFLVCKKSKVELKLFYRNILFIYFTSKQAFGCVLNICMCL